MGFTLPGDAFSDARVRGVLEDPDIIKVAHNSPVDIHTAGNHGVRCAGVVNTVSLARWVLPERTSTGAGYGLKNLMPLVGRTPLGTYKDTMTMEEYYETSKEKSRKVCSCGVEGCRKRKGHVKTEERWTEFTGHRREVQVPLEDVGPGHPLWDRLRVYAAEDAEAAVELYERLRLLGRARQRPNPFHRDPGPKELA
jgi:hypothetical protein